MHMQQYQDLVSWGYPEGKLEPLLYNIALVYCIRNKPDADNADDIFCRKILQSAKAIPESFSWKRKVLFILLKYCPPLFELICKMWGKRGH